MSVLKVPFVDLAWQHRVIADDVSSGFARVLGATAFIDGPDVAAFERAFAAYSGTDVCLGVANGTDAIELALRGADIGLGDEVIVPANSFVATAEAVVRAGATPVLVDADDEYLLIDPAAVEAAIGPRCRAIAAVHLFGQIAPMGPLAEIASRHGLALIEDAAQAQGACQHGAGIGAVGMAAATSFYPGKNLGAYGDGGAVLTNDADLASRVRRIRNHGSEQKYVHAEFGFNSRLDTLQAVVLNAKLAHLEAWNELRRAAAQRYNELLADIEGVRLPATAPGNVAVWHLYVVRVAERDRVAKVMGDAGVGTGVHYPQPIHHQPAFADTARATDCPVAEEAAACMLSLPMFPGITGEQQSYVVEMLHKALVA